MNYGDQFNIRDEIGVPIIKTRYAEQTLIPQPGGMAKFTIHEWKLTNGARERNAYSQLQLADQVLAETGRVIEETTERSTKQKDTVDRRLEERIGDVTFNRDELQRQRDEICLMLETLNMYKARLTDFIAATNNASDVTRKCALLRDHRIGIDLVMDQVDAALKQEIIAINGVLAISKRTLEELNEQMRRLRAARYLLDRDLQYKQDAIDRDQKALTLKSNASCLAVYEGFQNLDPATISSQEYNLNSMKNIKNAAKEVNSARPLTDIIDILLHQLTDDLRNAYFKTNNEFTKRIRDTQIAKVGLEDMHHGIAEKVLDMQKSIEKLQKALSEKECHVALAHTRLGRRAQRKEAELVRDPPGQALYYECELLRQSTEQLQLMLQESNASLRYLLATQIQLEEDINVKMNTLKIDEVDCMTLRAGVDYHYYWDIFLTLLCTNMYELFSRDFYLYKFF